MSAARKRPGVIGIITAAEIDAALGRVPKIPLRLEILPALVPYEQPVIATGKGSREMMVGTGKDDASDALDRRVEFKVAPCGGGNSGRST